MHIQTQHKEHKNYWKGEESSSKLSLLGEKKTELKIQFITLISCCLFSLLPRLAFLQHIKKG